MDLKVYTLICSCLWDGCEIHILHLFLKFALLSNSIFLFQKKRGSTKVITVKPVLRWINFGTCDKGSSSLAYSMSTTIHGFLYIGEDSKSVSSRVIWFITVALSFVCAGWVIAESINGCLIFFILRVKHSNVPLKR